MTAKLEQIGSKWRLTHGEAKLTFTDTMRLVDYINSSKVEVEGIDQLAKVYRDMIVKPERVSL